MRGWEVIQKYRLITGDLIKAGWYQELPTARRKMRGFLKELS
jgi:hypothetical protein